MAKKIELQSLSLADLARIVNSGRAGPVITERALRELHTRAGLGVGGPRKINFFRFAAWLCDQVHGPGRFGPGPKESAGEKMLFDELRPEDVPAPAGVPIKEYWDSRWRKARALRQETENRVRREELISREEVEDMMADRCNAIRAGFARLESEVPPIAAELDNPRDIKAVMRQKHRELLNDFRRPWWGK